MDKRDHDHHEEYGRYDHNFRHPEVVAAFRQKGTGHPITVVGYRDSDDNEKFRIFWNNRRHEHVPFESKEKAISYIEENTKGMIERWEVKYRAIA